MKALSWPWVAVALLAGCPGGPTPNTDKQRPNDSGDSGTHPTSVDLESADSCQGCHPVQHAEWAGSAMHMAPSPTFAAFEIAMNRASGGAFAHGSGTANEDFCNVCHIPVGVFQDELATFDPEDPLAYPGPLEGTSALAGEGVTCDVCHTTVGIDPSVTPGGDGLGTAHALVRDESGTKQGPFATSTGAHLSAESSLLPSSDFCGTCHDVRAGKPDAVTGEPFLRVEDTYSEWLASPWSGSDSPIGEPVSCQGCHMSLYPLAPPNTFAQTQVAAFPSDLPVRKHATHAFTAVSTSLVDDPRYPNQDQPGVYDGFGYPTGQQQRREAMLASACELRLEGTPTLIEPGARTLPVVVTVENVGAGHGVPSGFSQEREVWIELVVSDDAGVLYSSGMLTDSLHPELGETEPDGLLDDEDLQHRSFSVDLDTLASTVTPGPDADQRPDGVNLGLVSFTNDFVSIDTATGDARVVLTPLEANHADNSKALQPFAPQAWRYDVPLPAGGVRGDIRVSARLRFRAFPPKFLRLLGQVAPELVTEDMVDRNTIVEMAEDALLVRIKR